MLDYRDFAELWQDTCELIGEGVLDRERAAAAEHAYVSPGAQRQLISSVPEVEPLHYGRKHPFVRRVFMFRLNPLDGQHLERRHAQEPDRLGKSYVSPDRSEATHREPFEVDPAKLERSTASHMATQDALADWLVERDIEPLSPLGAPDYDIAWQLDELIYVCEVKSLTADNQARQLRLGLGQVLDYRSQLEARGQMSRAVLATSERPADWRRWQQLCTDVRVVLTWPDFEELAELDGDEE